MDFSSFGSGVIIGLLIFAFLAYRTLVKISNLVQEEQLQRTVVETDISCRVEEVNGIFYIWKVDDNEFVVQGRTIKEMQDIMQQMNKRVNLKIVDGEQSVIKKLKATAST